MSRGRGIEEGGAQAASSLRTQPAALRIQPAILRTQPAALRTQAASIRVGPFAIDQSYWQFYLGFEGANLSLSYTGGNGTLHILATPQGNPILLTLTLTLALTLTRHAAHTGGAAGLCPRRWLP